MQCLFDGIDPRALRASTGGSASYLTASLVVDWTALLACRVAFCCALSTAYTVHMVISLQRGACRECNRIVKAVCQVSEPKPPTDSWSTTRYAPALAATVSLSANMRINIRPAMPPNRLGAPVPLPPPFVSRKDLLDFASLLASTHASSQAGHTIPTCPRPAASASPTPSTVLFKISRLCDRDASTHAAKEV